MNMERPTDAATVTDIAKPHGAPLLGPSMMTTAKETRHSVFLPLALFGLSIVIATGYQVAMAWREGKQLETTQANQQELHDKSAKLRAALDKLASDTAKLAAQGNPNARLIVDELARRGVTINPNAGQAAAAGAGK
ncbi:MAG: hypothetical protein JNJ60_16280 [Rhodocyclaceae bacterium]|nr:hypothetical protein [Rhodocyclaceae bacterium]